MDKEKLINQIMSEALADGEPITKEEATEIAEMEIRAKGIKNYVQSEPTKERKPRERKVDDDKKILIDILTECLNEYEDITIDTIKNETSIDLKFYGADYTIKLVKHRPPKK